MARLALAGSDLLLVPGPVEPRATWLRRAVRYGTVPVALQCGGLFQLVRDFEPAFGTGNGFTFRSATADGLVDVTRRALYLLGQDAHRQALVAANLGIDFSHESTARAYLGLYSRLLGQPALRAA